VLVTDCFSVDDVEPYTQSSEVLVSYTPDGEFFSFHCETFDETCV